MAALFGCCASDSARRHAIRASEFEDNVDDSTLLASDRSDEPEPTVSPRAAVVIDPAFEAVRADARRDLATNFDYANAEHAALARGLFTAAFPRLRLNSELISTEWKTLGFQRSNPAPDLRASGLFAMRMLEYFFTTYPDAARLIVDEHKPREPRHYPVAAAGIALACLMVDLLQIRVAPDAVVHTPVFCELAQWIRTTADLGEMFAALAVHFEDQWQLRGAQYMTFPVELARLRARLENAVPRKRGVDECDVAFNRNMFEERLNDDSLMPPPPQTGARCTVM